MQTMMSPERVALDTAVRSLEDAAAICTDPLSTFLRDMAICVADCRDDDDEASS